jgi:ABC-type cobalamin/Fe3+-siderophores transport system ATPase subunit
MDEGRILSDAPAGEALTEEILRTVFRVARRPAGGFDPV